MRVECEVSATTLVGDHGGDVDGVCVTCGRCNYTVEVYGTSSASVRRAMAMLRDECPEGESNFYFDADGDDG